MPISEQPLPLTLPERYRVRRHIATGGMASVWAADDLLLGRRVAIKVLSERFAHDEVAVRRFKREARAAARVSAHPHVVTIFDIGDLEPSPGEASGRTFIVMEHLAGGTVADALRVGAVRRREAVRWLREAASALDHAHSCGIVHRDIKPANFLLDRSRVLHVADFGIARIASEETITTGDLFGTAAYLSPEQALGREATGASDRYALAVAAFELLAGERPFAAQHFAAQARQHIEEPPPRISERDRTLPPALDDVLARGMAKVPEERFQTATELVDTLETALGGGVVIGGSIPTAGGRDRPGSTATAATTSTAAAATTRIAAAATTRIAAAATTRITSARMAPSGREAIDGGRRRRGRHGAAPRAGDGSARMAATGAPHASRTGAGGRLVAIAALVVAIAGAGWLTASEVGGSGSGRSGSIAAGRARTGTALTQSRMHRVPRASAAPARTAGRTAPSAASAPSAEQLQSLGFQEMQAGDYRAAIPTLRRAVMSAEHSSLTYAYGLYNLGLSLLRSGHASAAIPILEQRLQIHNQTSIVQQTLAAALRAAGRSAPGAPPAGSAQPGQAGVSESGGAGLGVGQAGAGAGNPQTGPGSSQTGPGNAQDGPGNPQTGSGGGGPGTQGPGQPGNGSNSGGAAEHTSLVD